MIEAKMYIDNSIFRSENETDAILWIQKNTEAQIFNEKL